MDLLLENVPHLVPTVPEMCAGGSQGEETELIESVYDPGHTSLPDIAKDTAFDILFIADNISAALAPTMLSTFEHTVKALLERLSLDPETRTAMELVRSCSALMQNCLTDRRSLGQAQLQYDRLYNGCPDVVERRWTTLLKNKANLNEFKRQHPDTLPLEARKIYLPQGATLILSVWQNELNAFVSELESVSTDPGRSASQKAPSFRLFNMPLVARPGRTGMFSVTTHSNFLAPRSLGVTSSVQREPVPELAATLSKRLNAGIESPNFWSQTYVCFTGVLTGAERKRGMKAVLWRPSKL